MKKLNLMFGILMAMLFFTCYIERTNPLDENSEYYVSPVILIDTTGIITTYNDTLDGDSVSIVITGNAEISRFQVRLDTLAWSEWQIAGVFSFDSLAAGQHTIFIRSKYEAGIEVVEDSIVFFIEIINIDPFDTTAAEDTNTVVDTTGVVDTSNIIDTNTNKFTVIYYGNGNTGGVVPVDSNYYPAGAKATVFDNSNLLVKSGYVFTGWNTDKEGNGNVFYPGDQFGIVDKDIILFAQWQVDPIFTVHFNTRGAPVIDSQLVHFGKLVTSPEQPSVAGKTFAGWFRDTTWSQPWIFSTDSVTRNITLYAKWTVNQFTVNFETFGGSSVSYQTVDSGAFVISPQEPLKAGYTFSGWYIDTLYSENWKFDSIPVTANTTIFSKWDKKRFSVEFVSLNDSVIPSQMIDSAEFATAPPEPQRPGYTFSGWFGDNTYSIPWVFNDYSINANTMLYAKWIIKQYTVTFNSAGGSYVAQQYPNYGETIKVPSNPIRAGYSFAGWYVSQTGSTEWNFTVNTVTQDTDLFAHWNINQYNVRFDSQGGDTVSEQVIAYGGLVTMPPAPSKTGYTFDAWHDQPNGNTAWIFSSNTITADLILYAKWTINKYTVAFDLQGWDNRSPQTIEHGQLVVEPQEPTIPKHTFNGWYTDLSWTRKWLFNSDVVTEDILLHAKILPVSYTVTFNSMGATVPASPETKEVTYPAITIDVLPVAPSKLNYYFAGWWSDKDSFFTVNTQVNASMTVHAKWGTMMDCDGNVYNTVTIGSQTWMLENLRVTHLNDGTPIPHIPDGTAWSGSTVPGYCYQNNDSLKHKFSYGALYNWYAVNTGKLAPSGWHVASDAEWTTLVTYLSGESVAGGKLKEAGTNHWQSPNAGSTNESGFSALPGGYRHSGGSYSGTNCNSYMWTTTSAGTTEAYYRYMYSESTVILSYTSNRKFGHSVRCVKNSP